MHTGLGNRQSSFQTGGLLLELGTVGKSKRERGHDHLIRSIKNSIQRTGGHGITYVLSWRCKDVRDNSNIVHI